MNAKFCFLVVGREVPSRLEKKGELLDGGQRNSGTGGGILGRGDGSGLGPGPDSGFRGSEGQVLRGRLVRALFEFGCFNLSILSSFSFTGCTLCECREVVIHVDAFQDHTE